MTNKQNSREEKIAEEWLEAIKEEEPTNYAIVQTLIDKAKLEVLTKVAAAFYEEIDGEQTVEKMTSLPIRFAKRLSQLKNQTNRTNK